PKQAYQGDQRETDQGGGIVSFHTLEQGDAQPLRPEASRTVKRGVALEVVLDHGGVEGAESHAKRDTEFPGTTGTGVEQAEPGVKDDLPSRRGTQLCDRALAVAGLAENPAIELGTLIGADDQGIRTITRHRVRLGP